MGKDKEVVFMFIIGYVDVAVNEQADTHAHRVTYQQANALSF